MPTTPVSALARSMLLFIVIAACIAGSRAVSAGNAVREAPDRASTPIATEAPRPSPTTIPTMPPRPTDVPTATMPLRDTPVPPTVAPEVPSPPILPNVPPNDGPGTGETNPEVTPVGPAFIHGGVVTQGRVCPIDFVPSKGSPSITELQGQCDLLPAQTWHYLTTNTNMLPSNPTTAFQGQPVPYSVKIGKVAAFVATVEGMPRIAQTCASPQLPLQKVAPFPILTVHPQETITCTWYFQAEVEPGTASLTLWICPAGLGTAALEKLAEACAKPIGGVPVLLADNTGKDFDYSGQSGIDGTVSFTQVPQGDYRFYLQFPYSTTPLLPGTKLMASCSATAEVTSALYGSIPIGLAAGEDLVCDAFVLPPTP